MHKVLFLIGAVLTRAALLPAHDEAVCFDAKSHEALTGAGTSLLQLSTAWGFSHPRQETQLAAAPTASEEAELRRIWYEVSERQLLEAAVLPTHASSLYAPAAPSSPAESDLASRWQLPSSAPAPATTGIDPRTAAKLTKAFPSRAFYYAAQVLKNPAALEQQDAMLLDNAKAIDEELPSSLLPHQVSREEPPASWQQQASPLPQPALLQPALPGAWQQAPLAESVPLPQLAPLPQSPQVQLALLQAQASPQSQLVMLQGSDSRSSAAPAPPPQPSQCGGPDLVSCSQMNSILTFGYKVKIWQGVIGWIIVIGAGLIAISVLSYVLYYVFQVTAWISFIFQAFCCISILVIIGFIVMGVKSGSQAVQSLVQ